MLTSISSRYIMQNRAMNKHLLKIIQVVAISLILGACTIIFEEDLTDELVYVIMPIDGTDSNYQPQLFWWETVEGVIKYNLQIVEGEFSDPYSLVADTNLAGDKFEVELAEGAYEWRIRGWNNYSETEYFYSLLTITDTAAVNEK